MSAKRGVRRTAYAPVLVLFAIAVAALTAPATGAVARTHQAPRGTTSLSAVQTPIRHVVVVDFENHSFDSLLGFWCDRVARGNIVRADGCVDARGKFVGMPSSVRLSDGTVVTPSGSPDKVPLVGHNAQAQQAAMNCPAGGGACRMNGWQNIHALPAGPSCTAATSPPYQCITGYKPSQVPNLAKVAKHFAISDETFSLSDSPSWEGHLEVAMATRDGFTGFNPVPEKGFPHYQGWGCDSGKFTQWQASPSSPVKTVPSCVPDPALNPAQYPNGGAVAPTPVPNMPTIMDRLDRAGLSWKIYSSTKGEKGYGIWDICPSVAGCLYTSQNANLVPDGRFTKNAAAGTLPAFSIVTPGGAHFMNAGHNGMSITAMDNWLGQLVNAVENSPNWNSTAMFITWDDCGCFYDQVPPPLAPDGSREGPRVPMLIVSPWAKPGYTDTTAANFTGMLAYTEQTFGLAPLGANDAGAYPFTNAFNYSQVPVKPVPMIQQRLPASAKRIRLTPQLENDPT